MKSKSDRKGRRHAMLTAEIAAGLAAGAAMGAASGPPGMATGVIVGGSIGALLGAAEERDDKRRAAHDAQLDEEIGVTGGDLGAPNLMHPPAIVGAYSVASSGGHGGREARPAEGPMSSLEDDD
jgi:hypothetical protein